MDNSMFFARDNNGIALEEDYPYIAKRSQTYLFDVCANMRSTGVTTVTEVHRTKPQSES